MFTLRYYMMCILLTGISLDRFSLGKSHSISVKTYPGHCVYIIYYMIYHVNVPFLLPSPQKSLLPEFKAGHVLRTPRKAKRSASPNAMLLGAEGDIIDLRWNVRQLLKLLSCIFPKKPKWYHEVDHTTFGIISHVWTIIFQAVIWYFISTNMIMNRQVSVILWFTRDERVIFVHHFDSEVVIGSYHWWIWVTYCDQN